jgi:release factor glutamine methyltransferase
MGLIIKEILQIGETALAQAGCMNPKIDAEILMRHLLSIDRTQLFIKYPQVLDDKSCEEYFQLIDTRASGVPVQYITGEQEFMGITFKVNENVLIPRQDTETLVEEIIEYANNLKGSYHILDLCCGSGAIGISLCKHLKNAKMTGSDISEKALEVAKYNAMQIGVDGRIKFTKSDLFENIRKGFGGNKYNIIVSNPPYIESEIIAYLQLAFI